LKPLRTFAQPLDDFFAPMQYVQMQRLFEGSLPPGRLYYNKSSIARRIEPAIDTFLELAHTMPTPLYSIGCQQLHGVAGRVAVSETAFPHRYDHFTVWVNPASDDPGDSDEVVRWGRETWDTIQPFMDAGVYVNALEDGLEEGEQRLAEAYGPNYQRLLAVKRKYDPTDFFRMNASIKPTM
jgi:FAD/FMN-containing dehydrogenase